MKTSVIDHNPLVHGEWIPFKGFVFEGEHYHIRTRSGSVYNSLLATNRAFIRDKLDVPFEEVVHFALVRDEEKPPHCLLGSTRFFKIVSQYGVSYPVYIRHWSRFIHQTELNGVRFIHPTVFAAFRRKIDGEYGASVLIFGEGRVGQDQPKFFMRDPRNEKIWVDKSEVVIMPGEINARFRHLGMEERNHDNKRTLAVVIPSLFKVFPREFGNYFAEKALKEGKVSVKENVITPTGNPLREIILYYVRERIRYLDNYVVSHKPAYTKNEQAELAKLREIR